MELTPSRTSPPAATLGLQGVALFDLDRTLVPGSSLVPLGRELARRGVISRRVVVRRAALAATFRRRGLPDERIDRVVAELLALLGGRDPAPLEAAARDVGTELAAQVHSGARWLLRRHLDAGDFCVVLTAAPQPLAEGLARAVGAHRAIGTRLEVVDGRLTGRLDGGLCHGHGKLRRLRAELGGLEAVPTTAYGDSLSDLPVLERCRDAVAVNPEDGLAQVARARRWPVLYLG